MKAEIAIPPLVRRLTMDVVVTGLRTARVRIWFGCKLMKLAALVIGCGINVDIRHES